ncbi:MAG: acetyl-CoA carboxylase biotin carboxyl carrier protein subunit [Tepidiformaceae bacterium]
MAEKYLVRLGDEEVSIEVRREEGCTFVRREHDGEPESVPWREVALERVGDSGLYLLMIDNRPIELYLERRRGGAIVTVGRHAFNYDVGPWRPTAARRDESAPVPGGLVRIMAPMTGSIVEVHCAPGSQVAAGETLLVIESMKMNNELRSPAAGTVESVPVAAGQRIKAGDLLVSLRS